MPFTMTPAELFEFIGLPSSQDVRVEVPKLLRRFGNEFWSALFSSVTRRGCCSCGRPGWLWSVKGADDLFDVCMVCKTFWLIDPATVDDLGSVSPAVSAETFDEFQMIEPTCPVVSAGWNEIDRESVINETFEFIFDELLKEKIQDPGQRQRIVDQVAQVELEYLNSQEKEK